jgi:hypothetical protein
MPYGANPTKSALEAIGRAVSELGVRAFTVAMPDHVVMQIPHDGSAPTVRRMAGSGPVHVPRTKAGTERAEVTEAQIGAAFVIAQTYLTKAKGQRTPVQKNDVNAR